MCGAAQTAPAAARTLARMNTDEPAEAPFFHEASASVRFWLLVEGELKAASVSRIALHHRFRPNAHDEDPCETFRHNAHAIEAAARRRFSEGALEPVMLREYDLRDMGKQGPA